jgi:hypothetical protein
VGVFVVFSDPKGVEEVVVSNPDWVDEVMALGGARVDVFCCCRRRPEGARRAAFGVGLDVFGFEVNEEDDDDLGKC